MKPGIYKHYKGNYYQVLGTALNSETLEEVVVYKMLYSTNQYKEGTLWVRPMKMFLESIEIDGKTVSRFEFIKE